mmetsp:Transcript_7493/g.14700  ORF Transcript_7493/g.14700 Transcript_7493/m.14700 type:complete len:157 (+) Transcript_7493:101-571(+)
MCLLSRTLPTRPSLQQLQPERLKIRVDPNPRFFVVVEMNAIAVAVDVVAVLVVTIILVLELVIVIAIVIVVVNLHSIVLVFDLWMVDSLPSHVSLLQGTNKMKQDLLLAMLIRAVFVALKNSAPVDGCGNGSGFFLRFIGMALVFVLILYGVRKTL